MAEGGGACGCAPFWRGTEALGVARASLNGAGRAGVAGVPCGWSGRGDLRGGEKTHGLGGGIEMEGTEGLWEDKGGGTERGEWGHTDGEFR